MPAILGRKICQQCRIGTKCWEIRARKKMPASLGQKKKVSRFLSTQKIAGKPAIAGELTGL